MAHAQKTRTERSLDSTLSEIEALKARGAELQGWLAEARGRFNAQALSEPEKYSVSEVTEAKEVAAYITECETGLAQVSEEIKQRWALAGGLSDGADRLSGTDDQLAEQIAALNDRRAALEQLRGQFREDAHHVVDYLLDERRQRVDGLLAGPLSGHELDELVRLWPARDVELARALHEAVEARPDSDFAPGNHSTWQADIRALTGQVARRHAELELRRQERELAEVQAGRDEAAARLAAVGADEPESGG